ncbi:MAG: serine/threonine protein kinase [Acidobacteria bacterium]|nr:serine/threonine protein kinase [Acidobacteriota bacterium]
MHAWTGRVIDGKYRLVRLIGEGGMGVVYEAQHEVLLRPLAVKLLSPSYSMDPSVSRRFLREAQAAGRIGHDNICEVLDFGSTPEGVLYMVMPLLKGGTLATAISACRVVPVERTVDIISQTLDALAAAHSHGIVHRDLKPENIFLTTVASRADFVKVFDFGIAKILSPDPTPSGVSPHLTKTGTVMGTIAYMAPEQARGDPGVDHRADLYSVGAILYEMLTGVRMYDGATFNQVLHKVLLGEMKAPSEVRPDIPMEFESVIMRAVARMPDRRYPDAMRFRSLTARSGSVGLDDPLAGRAVVRFDRDPWRGRLRRTVPRRREPPPSRPPTRRSRRAPPRRSRHHAVHDAPAEFLVRTGARPPVRAGARGPGDDEHLPRPIVDALHDAPTDFLVGTADANYSSPTHAHRTPRKSSDWAGSFPVRSQTYCKPPENHDPRATRPVPSAAPSGSTNRPPSLTPNAKYESTHQSATHSLTFPSTSRRPYTDCPASRAPTTSVSPTHNS